MCLIVFAYRCHPMYPLVVAANRDEFYHRPTSPAHFWTDKPDLLAGRDLEKMGTWMGVTREGRFAAITNYRNASESVTYASSRGQLVADYLSGNDHPKRYLEKVQSAKQDYAGFNLLVGDGASLWYYANVAGSLVEVQPGIHGLSNHLLDTPWPKVTAGTKGLKACLSNLETVNPNCLLDVLSNTDPADDASLPDTGVGIERERMLSPIFIRSDAYGTRSSTVLTISTQRHVFFLERYYTPYTQEWQQSMFEFLAGSSPH